MTTACLLGISTVFAQEPNQAEAPSPTPTPAEVATPRKPKFVRQPTPEEDIRAIRQMMEEQALKVEAISQQVSKLVTQVNTLSETTQAATTKQGEPPTAPAVPFSPSTGAGSSATTAGSTTAPAIANNGTNPVHVVAKGETLTSIARHSKVTVAELLKLNKIENDRALQIGQTLVLPSPKPVETPASNEPK